jgi:DNA-directed RNA polymerase subunit RPC12/RpoP
MERSMIQEEEVQVVDYDVWIDEKTGYKKIEKYIMHDQASECGECGYYTLMISTEEMGKAPTNNEPGYLIEHLECNYCGHREKREVVVAALSSNVA